MAWELLTGEELFTETETGGIVWRLGSNSEGTMNDRKSFWTIINQPLFSFTKRIKSLKLNCWFLITITISIVV